ncbi:MAG: hypothetical protein AB7Q81_19995 [Gammaproteobacteria bacterium]
MLATKAIAGWLGIVLGALSLLLALVHFYAGPFSPQPTLEEVVAEKAAAIKRATVAALKGEKVESHEERQSFDLDRIAQITIAVSGGTAIVLAFVGFARRESGRVAIGAVCLGVAGVAFQFLTVALGVIALVVLIGAALSTLVVN